MVFPYMYVLRYPLPEKEICFNVMFETDNKVFLIFES